MGNSRHFEDGTIDVPPEPSRLLLVGFVAATFMSATLLFLVEPMVAKMLLPRLGGSAAVWNTSLVFFQLVMLAGYATAHFTLTRLGVKRHTVVQAVALVLPILVLPIAAPAGWYPPEGTDVAMWTILVLTVMVGLPFWFLSMMSPTLQRWFSTTVHPHAHDPYFLYAAGNIGSLGALLAYPLVIEPNLSLVTQARLWAGAYVALVLLVAWCVISMRRHTAHGRIEITNAITNSKMLEARTDAGSGSPHDSAIPPLSWPTRFRWIGFAAVPSALMLGVTHHLSFHVASIPMLWVIPLALYLITFILAFGRRPEGVTLIAARAFKLLMIPLTLSLLGFIEVLWFILFLHLGVFLCVAMVAHGRLSSERPEPARLTEFYLLLSVGGAVGGVLTALTAPIIFKDVLEYPITLVLGLLVLPVSLFASGQPHAGDESTGSLNWRWPRPRTLMLSFGVLLLSVGAVQIRASGSQSGLTASILIAAVAFIGAYVVARTPQGFAGVFAVLLAASVLIPTNRTLFQDRTFYGVHRVFEDKIVAGRHVLLNGNTVHGMENTVGPDAGEPLAYYHRSGPIGQWFEANKRSPARSVAVIGMGSGALAAYGRDSDRFAFYEIDSMVDDIARDPSLFSFVTNSRADIATRIGDGRLMLDRNSDEQYDLLILDAFSSDTVPMHLVTAEAVELYLDRISADGVLAFHISNRYFDLSPIISRLAEMYGLVGLIQTDHPTAELAASGKMMSTWVLLARSPDAMEPVADDPRWFPLDVVDPGPLWTDEFSNLLGIFRWGHQPTFTKD